MSTKLRFYQIVFLLILQSYLLVFGQSYNLQQFNTVRIAFPYLSSDDYLKKVAKNYNYIIFCPSLHDVGNSEAEIYNNLATDIRDAVANANRFGLRVIPYICISSRWAINFWHPLESATGKTLCASTYEMTGWENFFGINWSLNWWGVTFSPANWKPFGTNRWSPDPTGFDSYLIKIFQSVKNGFDAANVYYPLEFIHLGHDEPFCGDRLLIGGVCNENNSSLCYGVQWKNLTGDQIDKDWIQGKINAGDSPSSAVAKLLADEAYRRTNQVKQVFGDNVRTIIWGDMWDQGSSGGVNMQLFNRTWGTSTAPTVLSLPGLTDEQKNSLKASLIIGFWHYKTKENYTYGACLSNDYSFDRMFSQATSNGFKFIYVGCANPTGNPLYSKDKIQDEAAGAISSAQTTSFNYTNNCLGFCATSFDAAPYDPNSTAITGYSTLDFMATDHRVENLNTPDRIEIQPTLSPFFPLNDWTFSIDTTKWYRLVFNHSGYCMRPTNGQYGDNLQIEQWPIDNNDNSQLWKFKKGDAPGYYYPVNCLGKSLDVLGQDMGSYAGTWQMHNGLNQEFRFDYSPIPGYYFMVDMRSANLGTNFVLDVEGVSMSVGAKVHTWTKKATEYQNQIIQLEEVPDPNKWYRMKFLHSGQYMRPTGGQYGNIQIEQTPIDLSDTTQIWRFTPGANGYYYPINSNSKVFDVYGTIEGSYVGTWDLHNGDNQQFRFDVSPITEYYYMVDSRAAAYGTNFTLDVEGASTAAGAKVLTWPKKSTGYENQIVKFDPITSFIPQGEMATGLNNDGRLYVFARGKDNMLYYKLQKTPNGQWPGTWTNLGGYITGNIAVGSGLYNGGKRMYVFSKGVSNYLKYKYQLTPGVDCWSQWYTVYGNEQIDSNIVLSNNKDGNLFCYARGANSKSILWTRHSYDENSPHEWLPLSGVEYYNANVLAVGKFAVLQNGNQDLIIIASDFYTKVINYITQVGGSFQTSSSYWRELSDIVKYSGELAAAKNCLGGAEVFVINAGKLYHSWQTSAGSAFSGWEQIPGDAQNSLTIAQRTNGYFEVFCQGYRNYINHAWFDGINWNSLRWLPNNGGFSKYEMPIVAGHYSNGLIMLFAINDSDPIQDKIMYSNQTNQSGEGTYNNWLEFSAWQ